jgi:phosphate transport system substrate-binding protein
VNYYGVICGGEEEEIGGLFLDWMLSVEGQRCIKQAGYIPLFDVD